MTVGTNTEVIEILVVGLPGSGKSAFLSTLNPNYEVEQGWRMTWIQIDENLHARFIEPPAQKAFDFMWTREIIAGADIDGCIVLCDSTRTEAFGETVGILETVRAFHPGLPLVMAANKQDQSQAWPADDLRYALGIPDDIHVIPCVAPDIDTVREAVLKLLYGVLGEA